MNRHDDSNLKFKDDYESREKEVFYMTFFFLKLNEDENSNVETRLVKTEEDETIKEVNFSCEWFQSSLIIF